MDSGGNYVLKVTAEEFSCYTQYVPRHMPVFVIFLSGQLFYPSEPLPLQLIKALAGGQPHIVHPFGVVDS